VTATIRLIMGIADFTWQAGDLTFHRHCAGLDRRAAGVSRHAAAVT
jgi:hypothetical protein